MTLPKVAVDRGLAHATASSQPSSQSSDQHEAHGNGHSDPHDNPPDNHDIPPEILARLKDFPLFKTAPQTFFTTLATKLRAKICSPQEFIITEGEEAKAMYWIIRGSVGITSRDGEAVYAELSPGAFFGEIGILFDRPRTASVIARSKCLLVSLTAEALDNVLPSYPDIEQAIRDEAQERLAFLEKKKRQREGIQPLSNSSNNSITNSPLLTAGGAVTTVDDSIPATPTASIILLDSELDVKSTGSNESAKASPTDSTPGSVSASGSVATVTPDPADRFEHLESLPIRELLNEFPLFASLPSNILHKLALSVVPKTYPPFKLIIQQETTGKDIYFIVEGIVEIIDEKDNQRVKARLAKGSYFGEMAFLSLAPTRSASVRSVSEVHCLVLTQDTLESLILEYPGIENQMQETANARISEQSINNSNSNITSTASNIPPPRQPLDLDPFYQRAESSRQDKSNGVDPFSKSWNANVSLPSVPIGDHVLAPPSNGVAHDEPPTFISPFSSLPIEPEDSAPMSPTSPPRTPIDTHFEPLPGVIIPKSVYDSNNTGTNASIQGTNTITASTSSPIGILLHPRVKRQRISNRRRSSLFNVGPFPDFLQLKIFQYLSLPSLMKLQLVCQHWRQILLTSSALLNTLDLTPYNTSITDTTIVPITNFAGLRPKVVDISNCFHLSDEGFSYLVNGIGLAKIHVFKMKSVWNVSGMAIMDLTVPSIGSDLEEIDLSNCRKVTDAVFARLIGWVIPGEPGAVPGNAGTVVGCPKLKRLSLSYCKLISDRSMYHMTMYAADRIEKLNLTRCTSITDQGFSYWSLRPFPMLTSLCLADCTFLTDKAIVSIAGAAKHLQSLDISFCCSLSDVSIEVLALGCPSLHNLDLSFCGSAVSDSSLSTLALHLNELESLSVRGCVRVTNAGVQALLMGCASSLKVLNITQCKNVLQLHSKKIRIIQ